MIASDAVVEEVLRGPGETYMHGITYGGNPTSCAAGLANLAIMEREDVLGNVRRNEDHFREQMERLLTLPFVGDVRGAGYHWTLELVTDKNLRVWAGQPDAQEFVTNTLAPALKTAGVLCRAAVDQGGSPLIQVAPPLILDREEIDWLCGTIAEVLEEAGRSAVA